MLSLYRMSQSVAQCLRFERSYIRLTAKWPVSCLVIAVCLGWDMESKLISLYFPLRASQPSKTIQKLDLIAAFFLAALGLWDSSTSDQSHSLRCGSTVSTAGPPGKSHSSFLFIKTSSIIESLLGTFPCLVIYLDNVSMILNGLWFAPQRRGHIP